MTLPAHSLRRHMEVEVSLGAGPIWRRVDDVMLLNHGRSGVLLWLEVPEAPPGAQGRRRLAVTLREGALVTARPAIDRRNLCDVLNAKE